MHMRGAAKRAAKALFGDDQRVRDRLRRIDGWLGSKPRPGAVPIAEGLDLSLPLGVNVAGFFEGDFGVAEAARAGVKAMRAAGLPVVLNNVSSSPDRDFAPGDGRYTTGNPYRVNLVNVNAEQSHDFFMRAGEGYFMGRYNVGGWVWELSRFPDAFTDAFRYFDEVWAPSAFCADSISRVSPVPVVRMPYSIDAGSLSAKPDRARFGIGEGEFTFLFIFDFHSVMERKNPIAAIEAFKKAFGTNGRVRLVIKHIHSGRFGVDLERFNKFAEGPNITVIGERFTRTDVTSLIASCDCYVSLHRAEGFGLAIAEAMAMGKPVIATAYSGNTDFMDVNNSFPVRYGLTELERDIQPYEKGMVWAEPDTDHAAELMRIVSGGGPDVARVAERGRRDVVRTLSPAAVGELYRQRVMRICGEG